MNDVMSNRIEVKGKIHIGNQMELVQKICRSSKKAAFFDGGRPIGMPEIDYRKKITRPGELSMQQTEYNLEPMDNGIYIKDNGLCNSYGIFGAPGCGKTYLLMYLLRQILSLHKDESDLKYGGLILDPKAALISDIKNIVKLAGREEDLVIINTDELNRTHQYINVINSALDPYELGKQLVLAAQSAGVSTSDPYWILAWGNLFGAALYVLSLENDVVTLKRLMDTVLTVVESDSFTSSEPEHLIQRIAREKKAQLDSYPPDISEDAFRAINQIENFFRQKNDSIATIESIITSAYSPFQRASNKCYSHGESKELAQLHSNFYDQIIEEGKIILVSISPSEPAMAKTLCTLVKCLFQRSVLSRLERVRSNRLKNFKRPLFLACDEYSQVASEMPGQSMGDGDFFSQSRQNGCMGLIATQSVNVLQASSLKESWRSVFSNFGAKIFMRLVDNETIEEATKLAGESDWYVNSEGTSQSKDGLSSSNQKELRERKSLPVSILTQMQKGDGVILGSLDGSTEKSFIRFIHVPKDFQLPDEKEAKNA